MNDPYGLGNPPPPYGQPGYQHGQQQAWGQPGTPYTPPNYGQPGGQQQPPQGYVSYGQGAAPPNFYAASGLPANHELSSLKDDAQLWLLVAAAGFWFGFGWITGPLAWYFGAQIRGKYRALGHHPTPAANWAWGLGIASTAIYLLGVVAVVTLITFVIGGAMVL